MDNTGQMSKVVLDAEIGVEASGYIHHNMVNTSMNACKPRCCGLIIRRGGYCLKGSTAVKAKGCLNSPV
jgi:hypothetical protein